MTTDKALTNQSTPGNGREPSNTQRRAFIGGALAALLSSSGPVMAKERDEERDVPNDPFIVLLKGIYQPVPIGGGPKNNLGLSTSTINLNDGSYSVTKIYPVFGVPDSKHEDKHHKDGSIGNFYVKFPLCAYDLPGGALAMRFTGGGFTPPGYGDGAGGTILGGTFELTILEARGIYSAFAGGHNHMVDRLDFLADGRRDEFCFCIISQYQFP